MTLSVCVHAWSELNLFPGARECNCVETISTTDIPYNTLAAITEADLLQGITANEMTVIHTYARPENQLCWHIHEDLDHTTLIAAQSTHPPHTRWSSQIKLTCTVGAIVGSLDFEHWRD